MIMIAEKLMNLLDIIKWDKSKELDIDSFWEYFAEKGHKVSLLFLVFVILIGTLFIMFRSLIFTFKIAIFGDKGK